MINLKDELHGSGITSIAAENIRDLQPVVILQAIRLIKEIIEAPKNIHLRLRYKETEATSDGTCMAFSVEADDLSKEQSAKLSAARVLMPVEPIIDDDNIGLEEILMGKRQLANGTVEDLKPQRLDDDFFTRPNIAITQVSKVLYALGYFADFPNTQEKTDFIAAVSSTSLKQLKRALKNDTQRRTARTMMEGSLERFIDSCMKMPLLFQERPSHLDPRTLWLLQLIFESRRDGLSDSAKLLSDLLVREILGKEDPSSEDYLKAKKELGALRLNISREITRLRAETKGKQSASTDKKARELQEALLKTDELAGLLDDREKYAARLLSKLFADIEESLRK
jgi:hypothetical protein